MQTASLPPDSFQDVLARLPPGLDLDALARSTKAIQRSRKITDGKDLLRLALARGPGGLSLNQTAAWASMSGLAELSDPGLKQRLDNAVPFLKALMEQQLAERAGSATLRWPGRCLRVVDGTNISQPASQGTDWRVHAGYDLGTGGFVHLDLTDNHGAESIERGASKPGEVRIADRNYANAGALDRLRRTSANQADFIVRARWKSFVLDRSDGAPFHMTDYLAALQADSAVQEVPVLARVSKTRDLSLRLIIQRNSDETTENIRRHLRNTAARRRKTLDPRSLVAAGFLVLATSLPAEGYPAEEVLAAYRLRWQIELAFKRLKSLLHSKRSSAALLHRLR